MQALNIPVVFFLVARLRNWQLGKHNWVTPDTDIVIEGYPRSANTFLHRIVRAATDHRLKIGNHVHRPQQVTMALRHDIACFVLFRHPLDAISSYLVREPGLTAHRCLDMYARFAETTLSFSDHPKLFILTFEKVIADPVGVTNLILAQAGFDTNVTATLVADATQDKRADPTRSSLPNPEKEALKQRYLADIQALPDYARVVALYEDAKTRAWQP